MQKLTENEKQRLNELVSEAERKTNTQIVLALIEKCDNYPEIPWKAFSMGVSFASLILLITNQFFFKGSSRVENIIVVLVQILSCGCLFTLLTIFFSPIARIFLPKERAEMEIRQYAESLFLNNELFATKSRCGLLILVALFERHIYILPDKGIKSQLKKEEINEIIKNMILYLSKSKVALAFENGLKKIIELLGNEDIKSYRENELSNTIIEEKGV